MEVICKLLTNLWPGIENTLTKQYPMYLLILSGEIKRIKMEVEELVFDFTEDLESVGIYLLKLNNRNTITRCEICSKLTIKTSGERFDDGIRRKFPSNLFFINYQKTFYLKWSFFNCYNTPTYFSKSLNWSYQLQLSKKCNEKYKNLLQIWSKIAV